VSSIASSRGLPPTEGVSLQTRKQRERIFRLTLIALALLFAVFPILFIVSSSLSSSNSLSGQGLIPRNPTLENYNALFNTPTAPFWLWLWNSTKVATITSVLSVLVSALSAYAFSRFRFVGRQGLLLTIFLVQVFPNALTMVATFLLMQQIGQYLPEFGLNAHGGLILVYLGSAMGINTWLMKGFFDSIPRDLDESAMIDGASNWQIFWRILFPLVRPILAVVGILTFVTVYGDFVISLVLIRDSELYTLALGLSLFIGDSFSQRWGVFAAGALIGAVPIVVVFILLQDFIVGGLTQGAVKG
jgi:arabinogalactan oligomer / maltooligosaccharide transport system permease protein